MSCCEPMNRKAFLESKLSNFRAFIEPHCSTDELKARLNEFKDLDSVMPYLLQCIALYNLGQLDTAVDGFIAAFPAASQENQAFTTKLRRYLAMFVDVLTTS